MTNDDQPTTIETLEANRRWDMEKGKHSVTMDPGVPLRARSLGNVVGARLTDKKIQRYIEQGYYTEEFRRARREAWARKKSRRVGNFIEHDDGRKVYSPL